MRRAAIAGALAALCACAAPPLVLTPAFPAGQVRTYLLTATARTSATIAGRRGTDTTTLRARSELQVLGAQADGSHLHMTFTPSSLTRNGKPAQAPAAQEAELVVAPDGSIVRIVSVGGLPPQIAGLDVSDLSPLLGSPLPGGRLHLGSRWTTALHQPSPSPSASPAASAGTEDGRIAALRRVRGYDCAIVSLSIRRPVERDRLLSGQPVHLAGTEYSTSETAFAFRRGFPVTISTVSEAVYALTSGSVSGGSIVIDTTTTLQLESVSAARPSASPSPSPSPSDG